jgi:hypothetical protein
MKILAGKPSKAQTMTNSKNQKNTPRQDSFIKNDEWRKKAKTRLDVELFELHLLDFGCGG